MCWLSVAVFFVFVPLTGKFPECEWCDISGFRMEEVKHYLGCMNESHTLCFELMDLRTSHAKALPQGMQVLPWFHFCSYYPL